MKFIHAADIHLDSPLLGLEREGAPVQEMRLATRRAFQNLVSLAREEEVGLVLIAGDLYDQDWKDYNTGLFFLGQLALLRDAGIRVIMVSGNHDAASRISRQLRLPDNSVLLSDRSPQTVLLEDLGLAVHGQSYQSPVVSCNLVPGYPAPLPGFFNIGLLHTCADGRPGHEAYAPCSPADLSLKGYDYWALGHVHGREVLSREPWVVFSGNIQGRHANETGCKGVTLVSVEDGLVESVEERALDVMRWERIRLDLAGLQDSEELLEAVGSAVAAASGAAEGRPLAVRVTLTGSTALHRALLEDPESWLGQARAEVARLGLEAWIEKVEVQTAAPVEVEEMADRQDAIGALFRATRSLREDPQLLDTLLAPLREVVAKLPASLAGNGGAPLKDGFLKAEEERMLLVDQAEQLLLARIANWPGMEPPRLGERGNVAAGRERGSSE